MGLGWFRRGLGASLLLLGAACSSGGGSSGGGGAAHDTFDIQAGSSSYQYDCAEQSGEMGTPEEIRTLGCEWPASNPTIELDIHLGSSTPINGQTFDLATTSPSVVEVIVGIGTNSQFSSVTSGSATVPTVVPGTSGMVVVHSFDPTTGARDISLEGVELPADAALNPPGGPTSITVTSAEIVR